MPKVAGKPSKSGERPGNHSSAAFRTCTDFRLASRSVRQLSLCCFEQVSCHTELSYCSLHKLMQCPPLLSPWSPIHQRKCDASGWGKGAVTCLPFALTGQGPCARGFDEGLPDKHSPSQPPPLTTWEFLPVSVPLLVFSV